MHKRVKKWCNSISHHFSQLLDIHRLRNHTRDWQNMSIKCLQLSIFMIIKINRDYLSHHRAQQRNSSSTMTWLLNGDDRIIAASKSTHCDVKVIKKCIEITLLKQFRLTQLVRLHLSSPSTHREIISFSPRKSSKKKPDQIVCVYVIKA